MNILITGSTGFIGQNLVNHLSAQGHTVYACGRRERRPRYWPDNVQWRCMDFRQMVDVQDWLPQLTGMDVVINAVGIIQEVQPGDFERLHYQVPCALFQACAQMGVKKVIQISALDAELDGSTEYFTSKARADQFLQTLDIDWWVFKPSFVFGAGAKSLNLLTALSALPWTPLADEGQQVLQPVAMDDIAQAVINALQPNAQAKKVINLVGPEPLTLYSIHQALAQHLDKPFRPWRIASRWLDKAMPLLGILGEPAINRASLRILQQGNQADAAPFTEWLGRRPQDFRSDYAQRPASQAERWHAYLYFFKPLLRWSLALVWLWAGVVSALIYPVANSYALLAQVGINGWLAPLVLYGASLTDFAFGIALLKRWQLRRLIPAQLLLMLAYSIAITLYLPEFWLHPFGPIIKNLPFAVASLMLLILEEQKP